MSACQIFFLAMSGLLRLPVGCLDSAAEPQGSYRTGHTADAAEEAYGIPNSVVIPSVGLSFGLCWYLHLLK